MLTKTQQTFLGMAALAGLTAVPASTGAVTINVDGSNYTTLSAAVAAAYASEDGEDIINLTVDSLPTADGQILLDKPITINGDGNNNEVPCDLLVDMPGIQSATDIGEGGKAYLEFKVTGAANINNIRLRPNADGTISADNALVVGGIRIFKPLTAGEVGDYTFTNVRISGTDSNNSNAFVSLETGADLYNTAGIYKWGGIDGGDGAIGGYGAFQLTNAGGDGTYSAVIDHCHAGLAYGAALNIPAEGGSVEVLGGIFGHCGRDGIRASGTSITLQGIPTDRLRVVRTTNIPAANSHCIEFAGGSTSPLIEYVDVAGCNTANGFVFRGGAKVEIMRFCRAMGKFAEGTEIRNQQVYINNANTQVAIEDCTFVGPAFPDTLIPFQVQSSVVLPISVTDTIFTSEGLGTVSNNATTGTVTYTNCALPTDGDPLESLADPPFSGEGGPQTLTDPAVVSPMLQSPGYLLTLEDYDWSENQGAGVSGNGPGNLNVLRPSNAAYLTAGSGGTPLTGGAGALLAGIDSNLWMLME